MGYCDRAALITAISCALVGQLSTETAELLAADLVQLGDTMAAMLMRKAKEQACLEASCEEKS